MTTCRTATKWAGVDVFVTSFALVGIVLSGITHVDGEFTGTYTESGSAVTDENGLAVISTVSSVKGKASFQFCVTAIASTLPYTADGANPDCKSL